LKTNGLCILYQVLNQQHNIMICPAEPTFLDTNSLGEKKPENPIKFKKY
jgi:hypothetical protein